MAHLEGNRDTQQAAGALRHPEEPRVCVFLFRVYPFLAETPLMSCVTVFVPGKSPLWATDFRPYTTLMYGNGPGYKKVNGSRPDLRNVDTSKAPSSRHGSDPSRNISSQRYCLQSATLGLDKKAAKWR